MNFSLVLVFWTLMLVESAGKLLRFLIIVEIAIESP